MELIFIKKITKEGSRKVINVPKDKVKNFDYGDDVLVMKINLQDMNLEKILKKIK